MEATKHFHAVPTVLGEDWDPQGECSRPEHGVTEKGSGVGTSSRRHSGSDACLKPVRHPPERLKRVMRDYSAQVCRFPCVSTSCPGNSNSPPLKNELRIHILGVSFALRPFQLGLVELFRLLSGPFARTPRPFFIFQLRACLVFGKVGLGLERMAARLPVGAIMGLASLCGAGMPNVTPNPMFTFRRMTVASPRTR